MREGATTLALVCVGKDASVAIRGERGSYNLLVALAPRPAECSYPG